MGRGLTWRGTGVGEGTGVGKGWCGTGTGGGAEVGVATRHLKCWYRGCYSAETGCREEVVLELCLQVSMPRPPPQNI